MFQIVGNITVKETGEGIPNLVVAAFDSDQAQLDFDHVGGGGSEGAWTDRIGSVLTGADGRFELTFEREDFRLGDQEERPDLMLVVFAPEDSRSADEPSPLTPEERILHVSRVPRQDAGRTEAYAIRLLKAQLERFEIPVGDRSASDPEQYVDAIQRAWAFRDAVKKQLQPRLKQEAEKARAVAEEAKKKFKNLSAVPVAMRQDPLFVADREQLAPAQNTAIEKGLERLGRYRGLLRFRLSEEDIEQLNAASGEGEEPSLRVVDGHVEGEADASAVFALVSERTGGTDLVRAHSLLDACVPPERRMAVTTGEGTSAPAAVIPVSSTSFSVAPGEATRMAVRIEDARGLPVAGIDVTFSVAEGGGFVSPAIATSDAEGKVSATWILGTAEGTQALTASAGGLPTVTFRATTTEVAGPVTPEEAEGQLLARVIGQVQSLQATDGVDGLPRRPDQQKVQEAVQALKLEGGPADATAYHDFHVLQVAFKHVWTEAFDNVLKEGAEALYEVFVQARDEIGLDTPAIESVAEVNELRRFIADVRGDGAMRPLEPVPPEVTELFPEVTPGLWNALSTTQKSIIRSQVLAIYAGGNADNARREVRRVLSNPESYVGRAQKLLIDLGGRLSEPFAFDIFAPDSYNFGIMVTYRQKWEPLSYQAGDLVATIPLAPGETRKFTKKEVVKKSRAEKEIEKALSSRAEEASRATRAEAEIMRKASLATNFKQTAEGSFQIGIADISGTTEFALNQAEESASNKKDFREATLKAAEEYKRERELQVETTSAEEIETTTSGEISNPNNELTVTYLFYELQRRYRISEHVHRVRPVILVAQDVPAPHEIDEDWLLAHEWILRRVILDDSLLPALDHLTAGFVSDEITIELRRAEWETHREIVTEAEQYLTERLQQREDLRNMLADVRAIMAEDREGLFGGTDEGLKERREELKRRLEYLAEEITEAQQKLTAATAALKEATDAYSQSLRARSQARMQIDQLRIHVKQNILYYMQAIWDHEPPDQRFFRLYNKKVKCPELTESCVLRTVKEKKPGTHPKDDARVTMTVREFCTPDISIGDEVEMVQVADLDNPLGYKGNYIIFPLKEPCYLTTFMMREFVDDYFGVRDPDEFGDYTIEELGEYIRCVWHRDDVTDEDRESLHDLFIRRLSEPRRSHDEIIVPTGQLFIEALPGRHPLLEDFKLRHRMEDVRKVQSEVRHAELENLRLAARLVAGEMEDPDIEKRILLDRDSSVVVDTDDT